MGKPRPCCSIPQLADAARSSITSINGVVLLVCTLVGAALSLYADLFQGALPHAVGTAALIGWLAAIALFVYFAGRGAGAVGTWGRISTGARLGRKNPGFAAVLLALSLAVVFTAWSRAKSDQGGLLASIVSIARETQASAAEAASAAKSADGKADKIFDDTTAIRRVVTRTLAPAEALAKLGYTTSDTDICKAATAGNTQAMALFAGAGVTSPSFAQGLGDGFIAFCLEPLLLQTGRAVPLHTVFTHLPPRLVELNRRYPSSVMATALGPFHDFRGLINAAGLRFIKKERFLGARATPLMFAVWGDNAEAVEALLSRGVDPNLPSKVLVADEKDALNLFTVIVSPLAEARRLRLPQIEKLLVSQSAKASLSKVDTLEE